ncbi:DNA translocase FtsK 4TM domain-containing protein [Candidatus Competibacter phosphatis]
MIGALVTYSPADPAWTHTGPVAQPHNLGGVTGAWFADITLYFFGYSAYLLPLGVMFGGWRLFKCGMLLDLDAEVVLFRVLGFAVAVATACGLAAVHLQAAPGTVPGDGPAGGLVGMHVGRFLIQPRVYGRQSVHGGLVAGRVYPGYRFVVAGVGGRFGRRGVEGNGLGWRFDPGAAVSESSGERQRRAAARFPGGGADRRCRGGASGDGAIGSRGAVARRRQPLVGLVARPTDQREQGTGRRSDVHDESRRRKSHLGRLHSATRHRSAAWQNRGGGRLAAVGAHRTGVEFADTGPSAACGYGRSRTRRWGLRQADAGYVDAGAHRRHWP